MPLTVDAHAHIFHRGMTLARDAWRRPEGEALLGDLVTCMDAAGIDHAVLAAASIFGTDNSYMLEACAMSNRFRTTVIVEPGISLGDLAALAARGAVGVRFQWRSLDTPPDLREPAYGTLLGHMAELGLHAQLHDRGRRLPPAIAAIEEARVDLVVDHFGRPAPDDGPDCPGFAAMLDAVQRGRTWIKVSGGFRLGPEDFVARLAERLLVEASPERLVWGSDWPFVEHERSVDYPQAVRLFNRAFPDPDIRARIHAAANALFFRNAS